MLPQPNSQNTSQSLRPEPRRRAWPGRLLLVALLAVMLAALWQHQALSDWIKLYGYRPPASISALATETTMTNQARHLFYLNKPQIATKTTFSSRCNNVEKTIVLGCYHGGQSGIFILEIADNSQLHGVMQVTAAHEMLHAAYDRLSASERNQLDAQLQAFYDNGLKDPAIKAEINAYRTSEPGELRNEMHSIFGTEVANLPPALEKHYAQYFTNRRAVVQQAEQYQEVFRSREAAVKAYDKQLASLEAKIMANEATLKTESQELQRRAAQLQAYRSAGNISQYNAAVPSYNQLVRQYNALLITTRSEIEQYNTIVKKRNALVVEEQQLVKELSGSNLPSVQ